MQTQRWPRRLAAVAMIAVLGFVLAACKPKATQTDCVQSKDKATYTLEVKNTDKDASVTVNLIVGDPGKLNKTQRDGKPITVPAGEGKTKTTTVTVTKKQQKRDVKLFWPGPKGDDTYVFDKELSWQCPGGKDK